MGGIHNFPFRYEGQIYILRGLREPEYVSKFDEEAGTVTSTNILFKASDYFIDKHQIIEQKDNIYIIGNRNIYSIDDNFIRA